MSHNHVTDPRAGGTGARAAGPAPTRSASSAASSSVPVPAETRNVVLIGHSGAGKTTLVEALLLQAGLVNRKGAVTAGSTVSDFDDTEHRMQRSVNLAVTPLDAGGVRVTLIDTPGYADTGQLGLWCMGEAHSDVLFDRLRHRFGVAVDPAELRLPLRETFVKPASGLGRTIKRSGGHRQYGVCQLEVEPLPTGSGFEFVDRIVGGVVPRQFIPSVEKGVRQQMERGVAAAGPARRARAIGPVRAAGPGDRDRAAGRRRRRH